MAGILLFSKEARVLCLLAVDPAHRKQHIAQKLVAFMLTQLDAGKDVSFTTHQEGSPQWSSRPSLFPTSGLFEDRLAEEFGWSIQEFIFGR